MSINGKMSPLFDDARGAVFGTGQSGCAFVVRKGGKECVVSDGREGALYDAVDRVIITPGGRVVYEAKRGDKWLLVSGTKERELRAALSASPLISPDGKRLAFVEQHNGAGKVGLRVCTLDLNECANGKEYQSIGMVKNDASRTRLAYPVARDGKSAVVTLDLNQPGVAESESRWYEKISAFNLSDNGTHLAFLAVQGGKKVMVKDGVETGAPPCSSVFDLVVSRAGKTLQTGLVEGKVVAYLDGERIGKAYDGINDPHFSADGSKIVSVAESRGKNFVVVNGVEGPPHDKVVTPRFTPDDSRVVYRARTNGERFAVVADLQGRTVREHPHYEAVWELTFSPNGQSVGYGIRKGQELWWKVEKL